MRVLHIGNEMSWRGGENQVRLLIEGMAAQGYESIVAYPKRSRGYARFKELAPAVPLPSRSAYDPRSVYRLYQICRDEKIELIDAHSSGGMTLALAVKRFLPRVRLVVHRRVDNPIKTTWFTRKKYFNPRVDKFVCISNAIAEILRDYGVNPDKITVVRSAVDEDPYRGIDRSACKRALLEKLRWQGKVEPVLIGNASALSPQKGYETLLRACERLEALDLNYQCVVAGDGALEGELKSWVKNHSLEHRVHFLGHIRNVPEFLSGLDILAVPSNNEGLGTILLEGAFAGCTLVGTRVGGIPEIVQDELTGVSIEVGDDEALAAGLKKLILDPALRTRLAENATMYVRNEFSLRKMVDGNLKVYRDLITARQSNSI